MLMAGAPPGQRRPGLAQSADLIRSGLWLRLRPGVPRSARTVRAAVKVMYAGAAVSAVNLILLLALIAGVKAYHAILGHHLTAAQVSQASTPLITVATLWALVPIAVWLWMARACGRGRNWARIVSTVLFGVATLNLTGAFGLPPGIHLSLVPMVYGPTIPVLYWLVGAAAVWLLWRPSSRAYFRPPGLHAGPAPGADDRARPSGADRRTRPDQGTAAASGVSHRPALAADGRPRQRTSSYTAPGDPATVIRPSGHALIAALLPLCQGDS